MEGSKRAIYNVEQKVNEGLLAKHKGVGRTGTGNGMPKERDLRKQHLENFS